MKPVWVVTLLTGVVLVLAAVPLLLPDTAEQGADTQPLAGPPVTGPGTLDAAAAELRRHVQLPQAAVHSVPLRVAEGGAHLRARLLGGLKDPLPAHLVRVTDGADHVLTEVRARRGRVAFTVPGRPARICFHVRGYLSTSILLPGEQGPHIDLGDVALQPAAGVSLLVRNAPRRKEPWLRLLVKREGIDAPHPWIVLHAWQKLATTEGELRLEIPVPAEAQVGIVLSGDGLVSRDRYVRLPCGETQHVTFDLRAHGAGTTRIAGLPAGSAAGKQVLVHRVPDDRSRPPVLRATTDQDGGFQLYGLQGGPVALELAIWGGTLPLQDPATRHRTFATAGEIPQILEPALPVVGLTVRGRAGAADPSFSLALAPHAPPEELLPPRSVVLSSAAVLRSDGELAVRTPSVTGARIPLNTLPAPVEQIVSIPEPGSGGDLRIEPDGPLPPRARITVSGGKLRERARLENDAWEIHGLPPGSYRIRLHAGTWAHDVASPAIVRGGATTLVRLSVPETRELELVVTNWSAIPLDLRPAEIGFGSSWAFLRDGRCRLRATIPLATKVSFSRRWRHALAMQALEAVPRRAGERIEVVFPLSDLVTTTVSFTPNEGGYSALHVIERVDEQRGELQTIAGTLSRTARSPEPGAPVQVVSRGRVDLEGVLYESVPRKGLVLRGWVRLAADGKHHRLRVPGRFVRLHCDRSGAAFDVFLRGPRWSRIASQALLVFHREADPLRVWVPASAREMVLVSSSEPAHRQVISLNPTTRSVRVTIWDR